MTGVKAFFLTDRKNSIDLSQKNKFRISDPKFILKNSYSKNKRTVFSYCTEDYHPAGNPLRYKLFYARSTLPERMHLVQT